jgi:hypothetical protein
LSSAELPVREVVLFKHGVGYFERGGDLPAGETARLDFKASEMNDVLKSLTLQDRSGKKVTGLRYDSSETLEKRLSEFPFRIDNENPSLSAFLNQMKGARIELKVGSETVSGSIVSARIIPGDEKRPEHEQVILLLDSGDIRTFDLSAIASLRFADPKLQLLMKDYLQVLASARSTDKRSVYIDSADSGTRQLIASYMIPTPIWKSSYRLIFAETGEPTLEGWAIVDNTTGEDWTKVNLALVSGRPISFISRLYEPKYVQRPVAELPEDRAAAPELYQGTVADMAAPMPAAAPAAPPALAKEGFRAGRRQVQSEALAEVAPSSVAADTQAREVGDLFEYRFSTPVTVRKGESAMLPFLQQKIGGRKLLIYSDHNSEHPRNAAEITNSTGKTLDGGPLTIFDGGTYAGEALMETLKNADKRLISYAIDLGTRITTKFDSNAAVVREIHASRGTIRTRQAQRETINYTIRNVDQKAKTLIIERPARYGYTVISPKPVETTSSMVRFEVKLTPGATQQFPVVEEREFESSVLVSNLNYNQILTYVQNKTLSASARKQMEDIARVKQQITSTDAEIRSTESQINNLAKDQERIRQNIGSLNQVAGQQEQVQGYARTLGALESKLAGLRDRQSELQQRKSTLESELSALLDKLEF